MQTTFEVEFGEPAITLSELYGALIGLVVDLDAEPGYPTENVHVINVDGDGDVVVCETGRDGIPELHSTWAIPQDCIRRVVVKLGDYA